MIHSKRKPVNAAVGGMGTIRVRRSRPSPIALALALMSGVWEKISNKHVPKAFRGLPIALIAASILSMAVMAFR